MSHAVSVANGVEFTVAFIWNNTVSNDSPHHMSSWNMVFPMWVNPINCLGYFMRSDTS